MAMIAYAIIWCAGISGAVFLAMHDNPWLGFGMLMLISGVTIKTRKD